MPTPVTDPNEIAAYNAAPTSGPAPGGPTPVTDPQEIAAYNAAPAAKAPVPGIDVPDWDGTGAANDPNRPGLTRRFLSHANAALAPVVGMFDAPAAAGRYVGNKIRGALGEAPANVSLPSEAYRQSFVPDVGPAQDNTESLADAAGGGTMNALLAGIPLAKAATSVAAPVAGEAPTIVNAIRGALSSMGKTAAANPAAAIATEGLAGAESGAAGEAARNAAHQAGASPNTEKLVESLGQIGGPTAMQALPGALIARFAPGVVKRAIPAASQAASTAAQAIPDEYRPSWLENLAQSGVVKQQETARTDVGKKLSGALATPESQAGLASAEQLQKDIPGFNPGVARATADPELANTQQSLDTASSGADLRARQTTYDKSRGAIADKLESLIPVAQKPAPSPDFVGPMPATETPQDVVAKAAAARVAKDTNALGQQTQAAQSKIQSLSDSLPEVDRITQGGALRQARTAAQKEMDDKTSALRANIGDADKPITVTPAVEPEVSTPYGSAGSESAKKMTLNQILDRRSEINQQMRDYTNSTARTVSDVATMRSLQAERDNLDALVNKAAEGNPSLRAYTEQYKTENVPQFRQGASAEVGQRDSLGYGGNRVDPEKVAGKFFNPNEESAAKQFDTAMGHDPGARQQMVDHALDDIRQKGTDATTGLIKPGFVDKWLLRNKRVLDQMPQTGPEIRAAVSSKDPDALYARMGELAKRQRSIDDTKVAGVLGDTPEKQITGALNDWQLMRGLKRSVAGDADAENALRRAVFDKVRSEAPNVLDDPDGFLGYMKSHDRVLSQVLTPEHKAALTSIAQAAKMQNTIGRPEGTVAIPKSIVGKIQDSMGITVGSAASTARGVAQGRTSLPIEAAAQGVKFFNRQAANASNAAWDEALSNPAAAKMVQNLVQGKTQAQTTKLRAYLLSAGVMSQEPDKENAP